MGTGIYDLDPSRFQAVFALSSGNSIFVAASLLCEPSEVPQLWEVKRVVGNIGRAGLVLMIPPQALETRPMPVGAWQFIQHTKYDGKHEDYFSCTSLHLSFTKSTLCLGVHPLGNQDSEVYYLETYISIHDRDTWVADIDVLAAYRSPLLFRFNEEAQICSHVSSEHLSIPAHHASICNWDELLEREENVSGIVKATRTGLLDWLPQFSICNKSGQHSCYLPISPKGSTHSAYFVITVFATHSMIETVHSRPTWIETVTGAALERS